MMAEDSAAAPGDPTALITGGARRIGAHVARRLHGEGWRVLIHCRHSRTEADALAAELNADRPGSATVISGDLADPDACTAVAEQAIAVHGRLDLLVNNASSFYPTPVGSITADQFDDLMASNLRAPVFLAQAAAPALRAARGAIINLADIHGQRPLADHPVYCAAKAGLIMLTRVLAKDLAPEVRVNAIAPGSILWPEGPGGADPAAQQAILDTTPLARQGAPDDIAGALLYLVRDAPFVTGQVLAVDGGRGL